MTSRGLRRYTGALIGVLRLSDVFFVFISGAISYAIVFGTGSGEPIPARYLVFSFVGALLVALVFPIIKVYQPWRVQQYWQPPIRAFAGWSIVYVAALVLLVAVKQSQPFSRLWLLVWFLTSGSILSIARLILFSVLRRLRHGGFNLHSVVIIGAGSQAKHLVRRVAREDWAGFRVEAIFDDDHEDIGEVPVFPIERSAEYLAANPTDEIWIALPLERSQELKEIVNHIQYSPGNVRYVPDLFGMSLLNHGVVDVLNIPMINFTATPLHGMNLILKELEDRILAFLILAMISPLMIAIAIGVKLSSRGPVFYRQERMSWNGRKFGMLKFRSMPIDAEAETGAVWASKTDQRSTRFGGFLRKTSLDELPQFINVLKGDMSIVGPRPERPVFVDEFKTQIPGYMQKHLVKGGITGWAQVNGWRGSTDLTRRIEHDIYYIGHWSLWFDIKIIFLTIFKGFVNPNAY